MKYPNLAHGVKKIFTSEVLALIASVCTGIGLLMTLLMVQSGENIESGIVTDLNAAGFFAGLGGTMIFMLGAVVLLIIAFIFGVQGMNAASKDEEDTSYFKSALFAMIIAIALQVVSGFITNASPTVGKFLTTGGTVAQVLTTYFVLYGVSVMAAKVGDTALAEKAEKLVIALCAVYILSIVCSSVPNFASGTIGTAIAVVLALLGIILNIVAYVIYLKVLGQAKKTFNEQ